MNILWDLADHHVYSMRGCFDVCVITTLPLLLASKSINVKQIILQRLVSTTQGLSYIMSVRFVVTQKMNFVGIWFGITYLKSILCLD